jgi:hypothetical protein
LFFRALAFRVFALAVDLGDHELQPFGQLGHGAQVFFFGFTIRSIEVAVIGW